MVKARTLLPALAACALLGSLIFSLAGAAPGVVTLQQGWTAEQEQSFYYTEQGTGIMPASFLRAIARKPPPDARSSRKTARRVTAFAHWPARRATSGA